MEDCQHEPDLTSLTPQRGDPGQAIVTCRKCGAGGQGWVEIHEISWDEEPGEVPPDSMGELEGEFTIPSKYQ
jgi:hypothetical protein